MKTLTHLGISMPALGFGTWQVTGTICERMVGAALDMGYRHIDTAQIYGNEDEVGTAMVRSGVAREEIFLTTKVWMDKLSRADVRTSTEESYRRAPEGTRLCPQTPGARLRALGFRAHAGAPPRSRRPTSD